jgi:hypothetical protein
MIDPELAALLLRFETRIDETTARFRSQARKVAIGAAVVAGLAALRQAWVLVLLCLACGTAIYVFLRGAAWRSGPERAAPVLEALRYAPERVTHISHRVTSDSKRRTLTHWLEVKSDRGRIFVRADDWAALIGPLARRCPRAAIDRGPPS